jgi:triphosphoribosyl-dephospho-CoA synthetase
LPFAGAPFTEMRHVQRGAADGLRAAAERADALLHHGGVAVQDGDVLERHAELIGKHLREGGLVALAVR